MDNNILSVDFAAEASFHSVDKSQIKKFFKDRWDGQPIKLGIPYRDEDLTKEYSLDAKVVHVDDRCALLEIVDLDSAPDNVVEQITPDSDAFISNWIYKNEDFYVLTLRLRHRTDGKNVTYIPPKQEEIAVCKKEDDLPVFNEKKKEIVLKHPFDLLPKYADISMIIEQTSPIIDEYVHNAFVDMAKNFMKWVYGDKYSMVILLRREGIETPIPSEMLSKIIELIDEYLKKSSWKDNYNLYTDIPEPEGFKVEFYIDQVK